MEKEKFVEALKKAKESAKKRNFTQSFEISIALKDVDLRKPEERISTYVVLPKGRGKDVKVCAFVDKDMLTQAREACDKVIAKEDFPKIDKKEIRRLCKECDWFIAEATVMMDIAKHFGKFLAQKKKMPDPKAGAVFPPNANLKGIVQRFKNLIKIEAKKQPVINAPIGTESQSIEDVAENAKAVYEQVVHSLPRGTQQIKSVYVKLTMGPAVRVEK